MDLMVVSDLACPRYSWMNFTLNSSLASELSVCSHDDRKEEEQAKNTDDDPAHNILEFALALFGFFRLSLHFFLLS